MRTAFAVCAAVCLTPTVAKPIGIGTLLQQVTTDLLDCDKMKEADVVAVCEGGPSELRLQIYLGPKGDDAKVEAILRNLLQSSVFRSDTNEERLSRRLADYRYVDEIGILSQAEPNNRLGVGSRISAEGSGYRPAAIGDAISLFGGGTGTFGCRVCDRQDQGAVYLLSNWHVLAPPRGGRTKGGAICHPARARRSDPCNEIGTYTRGISVPHGPVSVVDAAIAEITSSQLAALGSCSGRVITSKEINSAVPDLPVVKLGGKTGQIKGVVSCIDASACVGYDGIHEFNGQIVIESAPTSGDAEAVPFCDFGDSGALVVTADCHKPVGLLFAKARMRRSKDVNKFETVCLANPIREVLEKLKVDLVPPTPAELTGRCD